VIGAVSCPQPPVLLPGLTGRPVPEVEQVRVACRSAITDLLGRQPESIVIVGGNADGWTEPDGAPLSVAIGRTLLADAGCAVPVEVFVIDSAADPATCRAAGAGLPSEAGLLVLADGSARRGVKAPGYLDPRAEPFDAAVQRALDQADVEALAGLDAGLAAELLVAGRAAWQVLAGAAAGHSLTGRRYYADAPFGVWYPVVGWLVD